MKEADIIDMYGKVGTEEQGTLETSIVFQRLILMRCKYV